MKHLLLCCSMSFVVRLIGEVVQELGVAQFEAWLKLLSPRITFANQMDNATHHPSNETFGQRQADCKLGSGRVLGLQICLLGNVALCW